MLLKIDRLRRVLILDLTTEGFIMKIKLLTALVILSSLGSASAYVENRSIMGKPERIFWSAIPVCVGGILATQVKPGKGISATKAQLGLTGSGAAISLLMYGLMQRNSPSAVYEYACSSFNKIKHQEISDYNVEQVTIDLQVLKSIFEKLADWESSEHFPVACRKYSSEIQTLLAKSKSTLQGVQLARAIKKLEQLTNDPLLGDFGYSSINFNSYGDQDTFICRQMAAAYSQSQYPLMTAEEHLQKVLKDLKHLKSEFLNFDTYEQTTYAHQLEHLADIARQRIIIAQTHSLAVAERARFEENRLYQERLENERKLARQREAAERAQMREEQRLDRLESERQAAEERAQQVLVEQLAIQKEIDRKKAQEARDQRLAREAQAQYERQVVRERELAREREREEENRRNAAYRAARERQAAEERAQQVLAEQLAIQKELERKKAQEERDRKLALELQEKYNREEVQRQRDAAARAEQIKREASRREKEERQAAKKAEEQRLQSEADARRAAREAEVNKEIAERKERERKEAEISKEKNKIKKKKDKKEKQQQAAADDALDGLNDFYAMTENTSAAKPKDNSSIQKPQGATTTQAVSTEAPECAICLESLSQGKVSILDCNSKVKHAFHTECIKSVDKCPHCRKAKTEFMKNATWKEVEGAMKTKGFSLPS